MTTRRDFIRQSSLLALTLPLIDLACSRPAGTADTNSADYSFELDEVTVQQLQEMYQSGKYTAQQVVQMYLDRIARIDKAGPFINSVIEINPDALQIAEALDKERSEGRIRGPLHGVPVMVKDNINTGDKMMTTAGALALEGFRAAEDAPLVKLLREAGAVLIAKTNLSEWANFRSTRSSSGWSSRGGQTRNPYVITRNPCGSSSGSGSAVAANLCVVAIGTETNGSIACPSSINGVVGIKPTVGLVSRTGIIPISHTQDTAGPMTRTVADAAIVLTAITSTDVEDPATTNPQRKVEDYTRFLDKNALKGKRIGIEKAFLKEHEGVDALLAQAIETMKKLGAEIVEVELRKAMSVGGAEYTLLKYEFKHGVNSFFARYKTPIKSLADVIAFNKANESKAMPYFKQEILEESEALGDLNSKEYQEALKKVLSARETINKVLADNRIDAICGPANGPSWCTDLVNGDFFTGYGNYSPAAMAGFPHITVPMGLVEGLPVGLNFIASAWEEGKLISIAYAYEQASLKRSKPGFKENIK